MPVSFIAVRSTTFRPLGDQDGDGRADAGDVLRHILTITNTGDTDALNVVLNDLLGGSTETGLMNISPIAFNDAFTAVGNTTLRVGGAANIGSGPSSVVAGNLLTNDVGSTIVGTGALAGDDVTGFTLDTVTNGTSTLGGTFNIFADGSFNYISDDGDTGVVDTFTYTIRDAGIDGTAGNADDTTSTATVSITLSGQVWYVAQGASGNGTSANPFGSITALNTANVDGANDTIYVQGNVAGQLVMESGEHLIGTGADLDVAGFHLADDGARSTVTSNAAGFGVTLGATSSEIAGINIVSTGGVGNHGLSGTSFGTLTISNATIDASGQGLALSTGTIAGTGLVSTDSDGGTNNVSLVGITGGLALGTGALSGATGHAFLVSGGSLTTTYSGNASQASASQALVSVQGGHTGTLTFSTGTLSATNGTGLQFDNADGTYNFNGTTTLNGGNAGVDITNGSSGTFSFGSNTSITSPTGAAFVLDGGTASVTYSGSITQANNASTVSVSGGHATGTVTFQTGTLGATNGTGLQFDNADGTYNFNGTNTLNGGDAGVDIINGSGGAFSFSSNSSITNPSGIGFNVNGGAGNIDYNGTISKTNDGRAIDVQNHSGGTVSFDGTVSSTSASDGINFAGNSGATIHLSNTLTINTSASNTAGFAATGGGTIDVTHAGNTINSGTATAINIANTNIGAGDVTFQSVSSSGGSATGIILDTTGSAGGLHVTGTGTAGSGGTIANKTGADGATATGIGIYLNSTSEAQFDRMQLNDFQNFAIRGNDVTGFTFDNSVISGTNGNAAGVFDEAAISFNNLLGSASVSNTTISNGFEYVFKVLNSSGTLNRLTMDNSSFGTNNTGLGGDSVQIVASNTATANVTVTDSIFINAREDLFNAVATQTANMDVVFRNNTLSNNHTNKVSAASNILVFSTSTGTVTYDISHNTVTTGATGSSIAAAKGVPDAGSGGTMSGTINANTVGQSGVVGSGSQFTGIFASALGSGTHTTAITNNTIYHYNEEGIFLKANDNLTGGNSVLNATLTGNQTLQPDALAFAGLWVLAGSGSGTETNVINVTLGSTTNPALANDFTAGDPANSTDVFLQEAGSGSVINLSRAGSAGGTPAVVIQDNNTGTPAVVSSGTVNLVNTLPPTPPPVAPLMAAEAPPPADGGSGDGGDGAGGDIQPPTQGDDGGDIVPPTPPGSESTPPTPTHPIIVDDGVLTKAELDYLVEAAIQRWADAGATSEQVAAMRAVTFSVENLSGLYLGSSSAGEVTIDSNAAGFNWFIDATPGDDSEFAGAGTRLTAAPSTQAGVRMDLLTTVMHELGHQIGLGDEYGAEDRSELMFGTINSGERRLPGHDDLAGAGDAPVTGIAFALSPVNLGTIPAGRTVTVQWDSTVNNFTNQIIPSFSNTSTISGSNFTAVTSNTEVLSPSSAPIALDPLTLGGTIWNDNGAGVGGIGGNGIKDGTEAGISGVTLSLFVDANNDNTPDTPATPLVAGVLTDASGNYSFANLGPGHYIVRVDQDNFDAGGNTSLVATPLSPISSPEPIEPDNDVDNDDNGARAAGQPAFSNAITLSDGGEPSADVGGQFDVNNTLDFGFFANTPPVIGNLGGDNSTFTEGGAAVLLDDSSAPELLATVTDTQTHLSGGSLTVSITANVVAAEDVLGISTGAVTLSSGTAVGSTVSVSGLAIGTITANGSGGNDLAIAFNTADATPAAITTLVRALTYANTNNTDPSTLQRTIAVTVVDGLGGTNSDSENVTVSVVGVNDEPTLIATGANPTYVEDAPAADLFSGVTASAIEAGQTLTSLTLTVSNVTDGADEILRIDGSNVALTDGNSVVTATNTLTVNVTVAGNLATVSFSGAALSAAALQTLVDGLGYRNASQDPTDADRVVMITQLADSGSSSAPNDNTTSLSLASTINVDPVNDAPEGTDDTITIVEDATYTFASTDFGFSDPGENDGFQAVTFAASPTGGKLYFDADGAGGADPVELIYPQTVTVTDIDAGKLSFVPTADLEGSAAAAVTFQVVDDGSGTAPNVNTDPSANTLTFDITPINDAPAGTDDTLSVDEDGTLTLVAADFGFSDPDAGDQLSEVIITGVTGGKLFVGAVEISTFPASVAVADLAGNLTFEPDPDLNGSGAGSVTFQVVDDSGEANDTDLSENTLTIDVNAINDAPVVPDQTDVAADEQTAVTLVPAITVSDVDLDAFNGGLGDYAGALFAIGQGTPSADDFFSFDTAGALFTVNGSDLEAGGLVFATFVQSGGAAGIAFTSDETEATTALVNDVLQHLQYANLSNDPPGSVTLVYGIDDGSTGGGQGIVIGGNNVAAQNIVVTLTGVNDQPTLIATANDPTFTEGDSGSDLFDTVTASTIESGQTFTGMTITVTNVTEGASEELSIDGSTLALTEGNSIVTSNNSLTVNVSLTGTTATVTFTGAALDASQIETLIDDLDYYNGSEDPTDADRVVTITELVDSGSNISPDDNTTALSLASTVDVEPVDDASVAGDDSNSVLENGTIIGATVFGNDSDPDDPLLVVEVNGVAADVGSQVTLASGALLTLNDDGSYDYDPNGAFDYLITVAKATATGAVNTTFTDSFTYALEDGTGPATVTIIVNGVDSAGDELWGNDSGNSIDDQFDDDVFRLAQGGDDIVNGFGGNDIFAFGSAFNALDTVDGGAGFDTITLAGNYAAVPLAIPAAAMTGVDRILVAGGFSYDIIIADASIAAGTLFIGDGSQTLSGDAFDFDGSADSDAHFLLVGGAGNDTLRGGGVDDVLIGGGGNNALDGNDGIDRVDYSLATGPVDVDLNLGLANDNGFGDSDTLADIENVTGSAFADLLAGDGSANVLDGGLGADQMSGGFGDDTYVVDNVGDTVSETNALGGIDTVRSSIGYTLGVNLETLFLTGTGTINGTGNGLDNNLTGNSVANILNGGMGADRMKGDGGNDTYIVDNVGDVVIENFLTEGVDTVKSSISFTLAYFVDNLVLTGAGTINGTGNGLVNNLTGNNAANILNGGVGADQMKGDGGDDIYIVDNVGDVVIENSAADGTDTVRSSVTFSLAGQQLEHLVLTGSGIINGTGNALANNLTGNGAANVLNGSAGADQMKGDAGNDTYVVDNVGDVVIENTLADGTDTVLANISYTLGNFVENLTLTGTLALSGTGNSLGNVINGNNGANLIKGMAGADILSGAGGADTLQGGIGDDNLFGGGGHDDLHGGVGMDGFRFDTALSAANNVDDILDFSVADDTIYLDRDIFTGITADGPLAAGAFRAGTSALDGDDRILFDAATGHLFYDFDGVGGAAAILFATVTPGTALTSADFVGYI